MNAPDPGASGAHTRVGRARERIAALAHLHAFISLTTEAGPGQAVAVKDMIDVAGTVTTCGSSLPRTPADTDAVVVARIRHHGGVIVGKTNLHPWAFGVTSANADFGDVRNPADPGRIPGGSSGGSAAAVAAGMCDWALGTDTGGSVRIPAALCGVVGLIPTHGLIDPAGVAALAPSLDTVGILAPDVEAAAHALAICADRPQLRPDALPRPGAVRLAVPQGWITDLDSSVAAAWSGASAAAAFVAFPARIDIARLAMTVLLYEAAEVHRRGVKKHPDRYLPGVRHALALGRAISAADYAAARAGQQAMTRKVERAMAGFDALLLPTVGRTAPRIGEGIHDRDLTHYTLPFNLIGQPAISLPARVSGLPVGIQLIGRCGDEAGLLAIAREVERELLGAGP